MGPYITLIPININGWTIRVPPRKTKGQRKLENEISCVLKMCIKSVVNYKFIKAMEIGTNPL